MIWKSIKIPEPLHSKLWRIKSRIVLDSGKNIQLHEILDEAINQSVYAEVSE